MNQDAAHPAPQALGPRPVPDREDRERDDITDDDVQSWIDAASDGDVRAFERLYQHHLGRIYALCLRMTGNASEAEEMTQEAFVRAWQKLDSFRGDSAFSSWLHRLAVNVVLGSWRSVGRYRRRVVAIEDAERVLEPQQRSTKGLAMDLEQAIAGLPRGARTVFVLHDVEGFKHREIAELTGLAVGTSKTQLHRARTLLRDALAPETTDRNRNGATR